TMARGQRSTLETSTETGFMMCSSMTRTREEASYVGFGRLTELWTTLGFQPIMDSDFSSFPVISSAALQQSFSNTIQLPEKQFCESGMGPIWTMPATGILSVKSNSFTRAT